MRWRKLFLSITLIFALVFSGAFNVYAAGVDQTTLDMSVSYTTGSVFVNTPFITPHYTENRDYNNLLLVMNFEGNLFTTVSSSTPLFYMANIQRNDGDYYTYSMIYFGSNLFVGSTSSANGNYYVDERYISYYDSASSTFSGQVVFYISSIDDIDDDPWYYKLQFVYNTAAISDITFSSATATFYDTAYGYSVLSYLEQIANSGVSVDLSSVNTLIEEQISLEESQLALEESQFALESSAAANASEYYEDMLELTPEEESSFSVEESQEESKLDDVDDLIAYNDDFIESGGDDIEAYLSTLPEFTEDSSGESIWDIFVPLLWIITPIVGIVTASAIFSLFIFKGKM